MILIRSRNPRAVWLCVLLCFVAGCASYTQVRLPGEAADPATGEYRDVVKDGSKVRVVLRNGEVIKGQVIKSDEDDLIIREDGFYVGSNTVIAVEDIEVVEHGSLSTMSKIAIVGGLVGTVFLFKDLTDIDETHSE